MKKIIRMAVMAAVMFTAVTTIAKAQDAQQQGGRRGGGRGRGANAVAILRDSLHVSDAILQKADSIQKAYQAKNQELMQSGGDMQSMRPKMMELRTQQNNDIKALLTDDQKAQFDKIMSAMMPGRRGGGQR